MTQIHPDGLNLLRRKCGWWTFHKRWLLAPWSPFHTSLPRLHCHWSSLECLHKLPKLASLLLQSLLHTTARLHFINANQSIVSLDKAQRLSFTLGIKTSVLTLTYNGLCDLLPFPHCPEASSLTTCRWPQWGLWAHTAGLWASALSLPRALLQWAPGFYN